MDKPYRSWLHHPWHFCSTILLLFKQHINQYQHVCNKVIPADITDSLWFYTDKKNISTAPSNWIESNTTQKNKSLQWPALLGQFQQKRLKHLFVSVAELLYRTVFNYNIVPPLRCHAVMCCYRLKHGKYMTSCYYITFLTDWETCSLGLVGVEAGDGHNFGAAPWSTGHSRCGLLPKVSAETSVHCWRKEERNKWSMKSSDGKKSRGRHIHYSLETNYKNPISLDCDCLITVMISLHKGGFNQRKSQWLIGNLPPFTLQSSQTQTGN